MTFALVLLVAAGRVSAPPALPLRDRCEIARTILEARGKQATQGGPVMRVLELPLTGEPWIARATQRAGKTIVRGQIHKSKPATPLFGLDETCGDQTFLLEHHEPTLADTQDPNGNHDLVIEIHLYPNSKGYRFVERLNLAKHAYCPKTLGHHCGMSVPPARLEGTILQQSGVWTARVTKSIFAG